jgi:hypothetical protein
MVGITVAVGGRGVEVAVAVGVGRGTGVDTNWQAVRPATRNRIGAMATSFFTRPSFFRPINIQPA